MQESKTNIKSKEHMAYAMVFLFLSALILSGIYFSPFCYLFSASASMIETWYPHLGIVWIALRGVILILLAGIFTICLSYLSVVVSILLSPLRREIALLMVTVFCTLCVAEIILRTYGYRPSQITDINSFRPVKKLILQEGYEADENGMTYISPIVAAKIRQYLKDPSKYDRSNFANVAGEISELTTQYEQVLTLKDKSPFTDFYASILHKEHRDAFDSLVISYVSSPINSDGFRSIPFRKRSSRKRVLLIGDSFTYGFTTVNKVHSFYDILLSRGLEVYNTGLNDADPPQYESVARKYISLLHPDIVVVNFYMGNDVQYFHQVFKPFQTYNYRTNAGYLQVSPFGVPTSGIMDAYQLAYETSTIPPGSLFNKYCSKTVISTLLWVYLDKLFHFKGEKSQRMKNFELESKKHHLDYPDANTRMRNIRNLCQSDHCSLILSIIPARPDDSHREFTYVTYDKKLFNEEKYFEPHDLLLSDYCTGTDRHFNELGHQKYAEFLYAIIDSVAKSMCVTERMPPTKQSRIKH